MRKQSGKTRGDRKIPFLFPVEIQALLSTQKTAIFFRDGAGIFIAMIRGKHGYQNRNWEIYL
jgi:hypothetical protein